MRLKLFFPLAILLATAAVADHAPDRLIYSGESYGLGGTHILQPYFERYPDRHPVEIRDSAFLEQLLGERAHTYDGGNILNTGWLRGYIATFVIIDGVLQVQDLLVYVPTTESEGSDEDLVPALDLYFPTPKSRLIDWHTGFLILVVDEGCWYMDTEVIHDSYILLRIEEGRLTDEAKMTGEEYLQFKRRQFEVYRQTKDFSLFMDELRDEEWGFENDKERTQDIFDYGNYVEHVMLDFAEVNSP